MAVCARWSIIVQTANAQSPSISTQGDGEQTTAVNEAISTRHSLASSANAVLRSIITGDTADSMDNDENEEESGASE